MKVSTTILITLFLFVSLVWWVQDQSRIVLWYYSILLLFVGLLYTFTAEDEKKAYGLDCCRIIVCGIYLWGGLNKLNPWFFVEIFPWFMKPFFGAATESPLFSVLAFGAAFTEGAIGVMLLFPRTRRLAVVLLTLLHLTILFCLGPLGHSRAIAVWPWNILMMIVSFLLFWNEKDRSAKEILTPLFPLKWCISFLVFIAPALWYVGYWNTHMSFHMYTGLRDNAVYQISNEQRVHLPYTVQEVLKENGELYPADWSMNEFAFTPHQEERVFFQIGRTLCYHTQSAGAVRMTVIKRPRVPLTWSKNGELTENLTHYLPCVSVQKKANG